MTETYSMDQLSSFATREFKAVRTQLRKAEGLAPHSPEFLATPDSNTVVVFSPAGFSEQVMWAVATVEAPYRQDKTESTMVARHASRVLSSKFPATDLLVAKVVCAREVEGLAFTLYAVKVCA
jgi:hypothetical protein